MEQKLGILRNYFVTDPLSDQSLPSKNFEPSMQTIKKSVKQRIIETRINL